MFHVILYQPEIPPNTGNIIRLCANTGTALHLVGPLGFVLSDAKLRRAGLDYHESAMVRQYESLDDCLRNLAATRVLVLSTRGTRSYADMAYQPGDALLFGAESRGLPADIVTDAAPETILRLPLQPGSRSLNLSNAVAVVVYEAWRQHGFAGGI